MYLLLVCFCCFLDSSNTSEAISYSIINSEINSPKNIVSLSPKDELCSKTKLPTSRSKTNPPRTHLEPDAVYRFTYPKDWQNPKSSEGVRQDDTHPRKNARFRRITDYTCGNKLASDSTIKHAVISYHTSTEPRTG